MNTKMFGTVGTNHRGFPRVSFNDFYLAPASLTCSSIICDYPDSLQRPGTSCVWLGVDDASPRILATNAAKLGVATDQTVGWIPYPLPPEVQVSTHMHLNREQVSGLVERLQQWLKFGHFEDEAPREAEKQSTAKPTFAMVALETAGTAIFERESGSNDGFVGVKLQYRFVPTEDLESFLEAHSDPEEYSSVKVLAQDIPAGAFPTINQESGK